MNSGKEILAKWWNDIPIGKDHAASYSELCSIWNISERSVRFRLHELSYFDNGDSFILIRSSQGKGFYRTDDIADIERYKKECTNRAKRTFAPLRKIRRVLSNGSLHKSG